MELFVHDYTNDPINGVQMLSFHNDPAIKEKYLARVRKHRELDNIIQGTGWENGKGCAVGCTLENYDHFQYPIELGLPEWLAYLEDRIFENLKKDKARKWPEKFLNAIPIGVDTEIVKHKIAIKRLDRLIKIQKNNISDEEYIIKVLNSLEAIKSCHEAQINKTFCDWSAATSAATSAARSARLAATSAAMSATSAAESAAWSAAMSAAWSAKSAADSAWSAATSATSAAWSATSEEKSAAWQQEADDLIECLQDLSK